MLLKVRTFISEVLPELSNSTLFPSRFPLEHCDNMVVWPEFRGDRIRLQDITYHPIQRLHYHQHSNCTLSTMGYDWYPLQLLYLATGYTCHPLLRNDV